MTAKSADSTTPHHDGEVFPAGLKKDKKAFVGAVAEWNGAYVQPAVKAASTKPCGIFETGGAIGNAAGDSDGDVSVFVRRPRVVVLKNSAVLAAAGDDVYLQDDQTVNKTAAGATKLGQAFLVNDDGVHIFADWYTG